jgi:hypothetical protein
MYTKVWMKFLPVIRIFLKRAATSSQSIKLDKIDFDKAGGGKKAGYCFTVELRNGKVQNRLTSAIALDLIKVLQLDDKAMEILRANEYDLELNGKCELSIRCIINEQADQDSELMNEDSKTIEIENK